jgi:hypothetical protein
MAGSYRESSRETDALRLAQERERFATFWREVAWLDRRIRVEGAIAAVAILARCYAPMPSVFLWLATVGVLTVAAGLAYVHQRRLRRLRCPRCGELYFGAVTNQAAAKMCAHCRLPRGELRSEVLLGPVEGFELTTPRPPPH